MNLDKKTTVAELREWVKKFRKARGWYPDWNIKNNAISLVLEATEFLEHFQWKEAEALLKSKKTREELADELADVMYWVTVLTDNLGIELSEAVKSKLKKGAKKYPAERFKENRKKNLREYYRLRDQARRKRKK